MTDTLPLFYPGRLNSIFGESGGGKTWVAFFAVAEVVRSGQRAVVIDFEDAPSGIVERLDLFGLTEEEVGRVDYRNPVSGVGLGVQRLVEEITEPVALVVVDSVGEAMAAGGVNSNDDAEVARWFNLVRRLTRLPGSPAVVVLDHIPKATDAPTLYSIGSQRKRAAINGASYRVDTIKEPAKGKDGKWKLVVAKDRPGNRAKGTTAAVVDVSGNDVEMNMWFHTSEAQDAAESGERFRPTMLMERVSTYLEQVGAASKRSILRDVTGKRSGLDAAIEALIVEGHIATEPGDKGGTIHRLIRSFSTEIRPSDLTAAHRGPTAAPPRPGPRSEPIGVTAAHRGPTPYYVGASGAAVTTVLMDPAATLDLDDQGPRSDDEFYP